MENIISTTATFVYIQNRWFIYERIEETKTEIDKIERFIFLSPVLSLENIYSVLVHRVCVFSSFYTFVSCSFYSYFLMFKFKFHSMMFKLHRNPNPYFGIRLQRKNDYLLEICSTFSSVCDSSCVAMKLYKKCLWFS